MTEKVYRYAITTNQSKVYGQVSSVNGDVIQVSCRTEFNKTCQLQIHTHNILVCIFCNMEKQIKYLISNAQSTFTRSSYRNEPSITKCGHLEHVQTLQK